MEDPVVLTVTFTEEAVHPFTFTEVGDTLHVESAGAPEQLSDLLNTEYNSFVLAVCSIYIPDERIPAE
jgi:uncharacterized protein (UPF0254 family)